MQLPIGYDNFSELIEQKLDFVDKTLLVKEIIDNRADKVIVLTRPRRFGKTLNLSMLHHFLAAEVNGKPTKWLFDNLKIAQVNDGEYLERQGQYPVIFISFKDIKENSLTGAINKLQLLVQKFCRAHQYLMQSDKLTDREKALFAKLIDNKMTHEEAQNSISDLSELLYKHHNKKVYILIDEYDTPIQKSYVNKNRYYDDMIDFMRGMLGAALKTNPYLEKAVITGILRIAKESLFSDLNNIEVYSLLQPEYSQHFGFTEEEVSALLKQANLETKTEDIRRWYNGYQFGETIIYNPWSIAHCINKKGKLQPYWINISDHELIKKILTQSSAEFKEEFELLLQKQVIAKVIDEHTVFGDLDHNATAAWSLLVMTGYLKVLGAEVSDRGITICQLTIPNHEVSTLYRNLIERWLANGQGIEWYDLFLSYLLNGDIEKFSESLSQILIQTVSAHDVAHKPEAFYHGLMLGFTASLNKNIYEIKSNRESGFGRYDILIIPKDTQKLAIILELKSVPHPEKEKNTNKDKDFDLMTLLDKEAQNALEQINQKAYPAELHQRGITGIVKIGIAFCGKRFQLRSEREQSK